MYMRGNCPIDGIFIFSTLEVMPCGYISHEESEGDHRPLWMDISKASATRYYFTLRLKCLDPRIVQRYSRLISEYLKEHGFFTRMEKLYSEFTVPLAPEYMNEIEALDELRSRGMILTENKCRKL